MGTKVPLTIPRHAPPHPLVVAAPAFVFEIQAIVHHVRRFRGRSSVMALPNAIGPDAWAFAQCLRRRELHHRWMSIPLRRRFVPKGTTGVIHQSARLLPTKGQQSAKANLLLNGSEPSVPEDIGRVFPPKRPRAPIVPPRGGERATGRCRRGPVIRVTLDVVLDLFPHRLICEIIARASLDVVDDDLCAQLQGVVFDALAFAVKSMEKRQ